MRAVPPPLWTLLLIAGGYGLSLAPGLNKLPMFDGRLFAVVALVAGIGLLASAVLQFSAAKTQLLPASTTNNALVTGGVFSFTRNPMYLGMTLLCLGAALWFGRLPMLLAPVAMFAVANSSFIPFEEAKMRRQFGEQFDAYCKRVRRWV